MFITVSELLKMGLKKIHETTGDPNAESTFKVFDAFLMATLVKFDPAMHRPILTSKMKIYFYMYSVIWL